MGAAACSWQGLRTKGRDVGASRRHRAVQGSGPLNNLNENKIILTSNCWYKGVVCILLRDSEFKNLAARCPGSIRVLSVPMDL